MSISVGVSTASLFLRHDNEEAVQVLDGLGVGVAEVFLTTFSEYKPAFAKTQAFILDKSSQCHIIQQGIHENTDIRAHQNHIDPVSQAQSLNILPIAGKG